MEAENSHSYGRLSRILREEIQARRQLGEDTNAYRVYDRTFRAFDFTVDVYAQYALVTLYGSDKDAKDERLRAACVSSVLHIPPANVIFKSRVDEGEKAQEDYEGQSLELWVKESGISFVVDLQKRLDTGIFLENQRMRLLIRELSKGGRVLNLFCYTGGYTLFAYAGGATSCVSVDTSSYALETCRRNMEANGFESESFEFVRMDAVEFVEGYSGDPFSLVIIDCPAFSNRHGTRERAFSAQRDHVALIRRCGEILQDGGVIIFRTAYGAFELDRDKLKDFRIMAYTSEMTPRGFFEKKASRTYAFRRKGGSDDSFASEEGKERHFRGERAWDGKTRRNGRTDRWDKNKRSRFGRDGETYGRKQGLGSERSRFGRDEKGFRSDKRHDRFGEYSGNKGFSGRDSRRESRVAGERRVIRELAGKRLGLRERDDFGNGRNRRTSQDRPWHEKGDLERKGFRERRDSGDRRAFSFSQRSGQSERKGAGREGRSGYGRERERRPGRFGEKRIRRED